MVRSGRCIVTDLGDEGYAFSTVSGVLGDEDVNIDGFSAQADEDGGRTYVITEDTERGLAALEGAGLATETVPYVAATLTSRPGELANAVTALTESGVRPDATFLVMAPWGPDVQVAFAGVEPDAASKVLEDLDQR